LKQHLSDLDELLQKVRNSFVREYIGEAVTAYRAGAYRAAVTTTWVAVCIDIIEKIRELSAQGDKSAQVIEQRLDGIKPEDKNGMLAFENSLLDVACDELEFISVLEKQHLLRLKEDRNICVHPVFQNDGKQFSIAPEVARMHIVQACNFLFVNAPTMSKARVKSIYDLITETAFPETDEQAFQILSSEIYLGRAKDVVSRNLLVLLLKRAFKDDNGLPITLANRMMASLNAIDRINHGVFQAVLQEKLSGFLADANDRLLKRCFPFLGRCHGFWPAIEAPLKVRIEQLLLSLSADDVIRFKVARSVENIPDLRKNLVTLVEGFEAADKLKVLAGSPSQDFKNLAIDTFTQSGSFSSAYTNGKEYLLPHAEHFDLQDLQRVLNGAANNQAWKGINQILNAGGIGEVFAELYQVSKKLPGAAQIWSDFWLESLDGQHPYSELEELLVQDGVINKPKDQAGDDAPQALPEENDLTVSDLP